MLTVLSGAATTCLVLGQAWLIANTISDVLVQHRGLVQVRTLLGLLVAVVLSRAALAWLGERMADRASASAKSDLRSALVERVARLGPAGIDRDRSGRLVVLATSGIDALDSYFARYLPQLFLAVIVPVTVVIVVLGADWISAVIIAVTVPLIPLFMSLVGASTRVRMERQVPAPPTPGRPLPRRGRRSPDPQGLRSGQGPGRGGPRHHRQVPRRPRWPR